MMSIILLSIVSFCIIGFLYLGKKSNNELDEYQSKAESFVNSIFENETYKPEVKTERAYGIPYFSLSFSDSENKNHAQSNGLISLFCERIEELCEDIKPRGERFDATMAVNIISEED